MKSLDAILILTNKCNLNCAHCIYACDITPFSYYISIDDCKQTLELIKNKLPSLNKLILSGGDAFMHPQIIQICEEARKILPDTEICAYSNGLILQNFSDQDIIYLTQNLKISILSSLYPSIKNLNEYKKQDERFKRLGSQLYYQSSHFYFNRQTYKYHNLNIPQKNIDEFFHKACRTLTKYNDLITIYKNKILVCCGEVGFLNCRQDVDTSDLLDLNTLNSEKEIYDFCEKPHNICKDCFANKHYSDYSLLWLKSNDLTKKYQETSLRTMFVKNYNDYKKIFLNCDEHYFCLNDKFFEEKFLDVLPGEKNYLDIKFKNGIGDVFIPYDYSFNEQKRRALQEKLLEIEEIEKYNLYFVGINATQKYDTLMFNDFFMTCFTEPLKGVLLKSQTLYEGYKEFLKYSYLDNKILLDVNNFLTSNKRSF